MPVQRLDIWSAAAITPEARGTGLYVGHFLLNIYGSQLTDKFIMARVWT